MGPAAAAAAESAADRLASSSNYWVQRLLQSLLRRRYVSAWGSRSVGVLDPGASLRSTRGLDVL